MKYDPIKKTVATKADKSIFLLDSIDQDMVVNYKKTTTTIDKQVFEKERLENDSVSTFQSKHAPPTEIATGQAKKQKHLMKEVQHLRPQVYPEPRNTLSIQK